MKRETVKICILFLFIVSVFFYPLFTGLVPFPGDLLIGGYTPYNSYEFLGYAPGGFPNKGQSFDVLRLIYPAKIFSVRMLQQFEIPLWNPYIFSGTPHLAGLQSGTFYIFNLLFWLLPTAEAWSVYIMLQPFLAGLFMYLLLREYKLSVASAIFGSMVFSFSAFMTVWMEYGNLGHAILWLPLAMLLVIRNVKKPNLLRSVSIILVLSLSILAGYIQITFYIFVYLFIFTLLQINPLRRGGGRLFIFYSVIFITPLLLTAVQLLPTAELILQSARSSYTTDAMIKLLIPPIHGVTLFASDFFGNPATRNYWLQGTYIERVSYIGVIPLFFMLYGFMLRKSREEKFFIIALFCVVALAYDTFISRMFYSFQIPLLSTTVPSRIMFLFSFFTAILSAFGYEKFINQLKVKYFMKTAGIMIFIYILLWGAAFFVFPLLPIESFGAYAVTAKRNLILPTAYLAAGLAIMVFYLKRKRFKPFFFGFIFLLALFDLFYFFHKITPFSPKAALYPETEVLAQLKQIQGINRYWGYGTARIDPNIPTYEKIFSTDGYDALHSLRYGELVTASLNGKIAAAIPGSTADIVQGYGEDDLRENSYRQKMLNITGVKYLLHKNESLQEVIAPDYRTFPQDKYRLTWQQGVWQIYENKEALPRFFLASRYIVEQDKQNIINTLLADSFNPGNTVILEEPLPARFRIQEAENKKAELITYSPHKIVIQTQSSRDTLLYLSDSYYPGWRVSIDEKDAKIYRANYSFRAVPVQAGNHTVIFTYYPVTLDIGLKISISTVLILSAIISFSKYKSNYV